MSFVLLSENSAVMVAESIVTWKSVAFRFASEFKLMEPVELVPLVPLVPFVPVVPFVPLLVLLVLVVVEVTFGCSVSVIFCGGLIPNVRFLSRLICITATSTTTSGFDLSRSPTSFCASAT